MADGMRGRKAIDMIGKKYGRLIILERVHTYSDIGRPHYLCQCDCGNIIIAEGRNIRRGTTRSCGCLRRERVQGLWKFRWGEKKND